MFYWHLVQFVVIWYIFSRFGVLYQEKSGNPGLVWNAHTFKTSAFSQKRQKSKFNKLVQKTSFVPILQQSTESEKNIYQGCQIFRGTTFQNGEKYTK
jgi:hypothetical protein